MNLLTGYNFTENYNILNINERNASYTRVELNSNEIRIHISLTFGNDPTLVKNYRINFYSNKYLPIKIIGCFSSGSDQRLSWF